MLALVLAALLLGTPDPPVRAGDPIPGLGGMPGTAQAQKPKHDTVKNAVGNVKAVAGDPPPCTPDPCKAAASDPIPGVDDARPKPTPQKPKFP